MANIKIREMNEKDIEDILYLEAKFPPKSREIITKEKMNELFLKNPNACLVAEENYRIVGAIFGEPRRDGCKIISLIIDLDKLGEDISSKLIKELSERTGLKNIIK
ncbi:MAG: GNAT family N-acetyltransferase [Candidatus Aenigmatarchaeota archaeon]